MYISETWLIITEVKGRQDRRNGVIGSISKAAEPLKETEV